MQMLRCICVDIFKSENKKKNCEHLLAVRGKIVDLYPKETLKRNHLLICNNLKRNYE